MDIYSFAYTSHGLATGNLYHERSYLFADSPEQARLNAEYLMSRWNASLPKDWKYDRLREIRLESDELPADTWIHGNEFGADPHNNGTRYAYLKR